MKFTPPIYVRSICSKTLNTRFALLLAVYAFCLTGLIYGQRTADRPINSIKNEVEKPVMASAATVPTAPTFFETFSGNPTCADIAARYPNDNVVEPTGLKLDFSGVYSDTFLFNNYTSPYGNVVLLPANSTPTNPVQTITVATSGVNSITSFLSQKPITAVVIKAGNLANVWYYNVPGFGYTFDGGNLTAENQQGTSHLVFCYEQDVTPTAASIAISGRVTTREGRGITNAIVRLTDNTGNSRYVFTGRTGGYLFEDVESGQTYIISVSSRRFSFDNAAQIITPTDNLSDFDFVATQ